MLKSYSTSKRRGLDGLPLLSKRSQLEHEKEKRKRNWRVGRRHNVDPLPICPRLFPPGCILSLQIDCSSGILGICPGGTDDGFFLSK